MLFYEVIDEFNVILDEFDYLRLSFYIISIIIFLLGFFFFLKKYRKDQAQCFFWIALVLLSFSIARLFGMILIFFIGRPLLNEPYEGAALICQIIIIMSISSAYFSLYYYFEKTTIKKTHYGFSFLTIVTCFLSLIALTNRTPFFILALSVLGIALSAFIAFIYLGLAIRSNGIVRVNSIIIAIAFFVIGFATFIGESWTLEFKSTISSIINYDIPDSLISIIAPILFLISGICFIIGFRKGT